MLVRFWTNVTTGENIRYSVSFTNPGLTTPCRSAASRLQKMKMSSIIFEAGIRVKRDKLMILGPFKTLRDIQAIARRVREFLFVWLEREAFLICSFHDLEAFSYWSWDDKYLG